MVKNSSMSSSDRLPLPDFFDDRLDFFSFRDFFDHFRFFFDSGCVNCDVSVNSIGVDVVKASVIIVVVVTSGAIDNEVGLIVVGVEDESSGRTSFKAFTKIRY